MEENIEKAFNKINDLCNNLESLIFKDTETLAEPVKKSIDEAIQQLHLQFEVLRSANVLKDSPSINARNRACYAVRFVALEINNHLGDVEYAQFLLENSHVYASNDALKARIKIDIDILSSNMKFLDDVEYIDKMIDDEKFSEALVLINHHLDNHNACEEIIYELTERKRYCIVAESKLFEDKASDYFRNDDFNLARKYLSLANKLISDNISIFAINFEALTKDTNNMVQLMSEMTQYVDKEIDHWRNDYINTLEQEFEDHIDRSAACLYIDSQFFGTIVDKAIQYNRNPIVSGGSWGKKFILIALLIGGIVAYNFFMD